LLVIDPASGQAVERQHYFSLIYNYAAPGMLLTRLDHLLKQTVLNINLLT
jgi:hypothetical protein